MGTPSLLPDCGGAIRTIALALPKAFFADEWSDRSVLPLIPIGNLLSALPRDTRPVIVIDQACLASAQGWLDSLQIPSSPELVTLAAGNEVSSPWIQDLFHVRSAGRPGEPLTELVSQGHDAVASRLADYLECESTVGNVALAGGNQLVGPDFRLVGHASLQEERHVGSSAGGESRWRKVQALDSRPVHSFFYRLEDIGRTSPPFKPAGAEDAGPVMTGSRMHQCGFHVDQFVSVTGLVRDGFPLLLVADPVGASGSCARAAVDLKQKLDASALTLTRQGFSVERNPIPLLPSIDTNKCLPRLYNNVLLENVTRSGQESPLVWIPHFSDREALEEFDAENRKLWEMLGFQAIGVNGWSHLASRNGALRCATKVVNRRAAFSPCGNAASLRQ